jgi:hypothetical protein
VLQSDKVEAKILAERRKGPFVPFEQVTAKLGLDNRARPPRASRDASLQSGARPRSWPHMTSASRRGRAAAEPGPTKRVEDVRAELGLAKAKRRRKRA